MALAIVMIIALAVLARPDSASGSGHLEVEMEAGVLLLSTGPDAADNWVEYYPNAVLPEPGDPDADLGSPEGPKQLLLSDNRCNIALTGSLLDLEPGGGNGDAAIVDNGIGVKTKGNCSAAQGRIGPGQSITLSLGSKWDDDPAMSFKTIEVDAEGKFNAELGWELDDGRVGSEPLSSGSDNGSDSGADDNDIATIGDQTTTPFNTITFTASGLQDNSEVSIEGGGDGTVVGGTLRPAFATNKSLFQLVRFVKYDGELGCDEENNTATAVGDDGEEGEDDDPADRVLVTRLANKSGGACVVVPYQLVIDDVSGSVLFEPLLLGDQADAQFLVRVDWAPYADPFSPPHRRISLSGDPADYTDVVACSGLVEGPSPEDPRPDNDDDIEHPPGVLWCMAGDRQDLQPDGLWQQIQWYHGGGDPRFI